eukprot:TRINITY_DN66224_c8_g3_i2.p1 TRINITY_DN66224_c8_g3~~TRINITY_DN66224_c8_g3_i2.p1  ORF type:complete len:462 (+),score=36.17 TRINITY_DN66224_c8_g3_i2:82-1386(+)
MGENLKKYKYAGEDRSYIYRYLLTPMNNWLVTFFPPWLAPNTVTVTGFLNVILAHIVIWYYCPNLSGEPPTWAIILCAVTLFIYQTLDNLDGKQARRTGTSSPLGLLFDHGCDAVNTTVGTLTSCSVMQMGPSWKSFALLASPAVVFYFNTWEEYYIGSLVLPPINGATEGLLIAVGLYFWTAYVGVGWWLNSILVPVPNFVASLIDWCLDWAPQWQSVEKEATLNSGAVEVKYNTILVIFTIAGAIITVLGNVKTVVVAIIKKQRHGRTPAFVTNRFIALCYALLQTLPMMTLIILTAVWISVSPSHIVLQHPRLICWTVGLLFAKLVTHLQIAHVCAAEYKPYSRTMIPLFFTAIHIGLTLYLTPKEARGATTTGKGNGEYNRNVQEELILYEFFLLSLFAYVHLTGGVIKEMTHVLGIYCFSVKKRPKKLQ